MRSLRAIKDQEKAPNKAAKRTLCFNELIEARQDGGETVSTSSNSISDLHKLEHELKEEFGENKMALTKLLMLFETT